MDYKEQYSLYNYRVYGLNIESEMEIEEFTSINNRADESESIKIVYGRTQDDIQLKNNYNSTMKITSQYVWFDVKEVATFYIENGNKIIVTPYEKAEKNQIKVYVMCSCLGFIMLQREQVAIHGGAVEKEEKGIIITGDRGAGKSTLTTALRMKGYKFISDDVAAVVMDNKPILKAGFSYQKLCIDAMDKLGYDKEEYQAIRGGNQTKYMVPVKEHFVEEDMKLEMIIEVCKGKVNEVQMDIITGKEKLLHIIRNIYRGESIPRLGGMKAEYLRQCIDIAHNIKYYKITRPYNGFTVDEQVRLIESVV